MSATINTRIQIKHDTTENWNNAVGFIPLQGELIVYDDYESQTYVIEQNNETITKTINVPNIKIGTGNAYIQDLPFVDEKIRDILMKHVDNHDIHVTLGEKQFWNNKINIDDSNDVVHDELVEETLILNRN